MKYKIEKTGIDTTGYDSIFPNVETGVVMIDIESGNDYILEPTLPEKYDLIVSSETPLTFLHHLKTIHRERADIVLVKGVINDDFKYLKETGYITQLGLHYPSCVENIMSSEGISWISMKLSPLNFDLGMIKYCEDKGIGIIGVIEDKIDYPETFNLSFYARYCNIVLLPISSNFMDRQEYLLDLVGKDSPKEVEMKKSVHKNGKLNIGVSLKINEDLIIPCPSNNTLLYPSEAVFCLGGFIEKTPKQDPEEYDELEKLVYNLWESTYKDTTFDRSKLLNIFRYRISDILDKPYNIGRISDYAVVFVIKYKKKDIRNYLLFIKEDNSLYFSKLKNTEEEE